MSRGGATHRADARVPAGAMGTDRVSDTIATRLAAEVSRQLDINARLGEGLLRELDHVTGNGRPVLDAEGEVVATSYVPDRDWARCYGHYRGTNKDLLTEQREGIKLRHALQQTGKELTDAEYASEMLELGKETLRTLTTEEVTSALAERGLRVEPVEETD
jgi:hypothetical protein